MASARPACYSRGVPTRSPAPITVLGLTVSDTRTEKTDGTREHLEAFAGAVGAERFDHELLPDDRDAIRAMLHDATERGIDFVIFAGGTGLAPRDVTVETVAPMFEKVLGGFGELFRALSVESVGARAILSRAAAGTIGKSLVFVLPGSPKAVQLALEGVVLPIAQHARAIAQDLGSHPAVKHGG